MLLAAAVLAGCGEAPSSGGPCPPGQRCLRAGNFADPGTLDPALSFVKPDQTVINDLLVGLTTFDAAGMPMPGMATHWETTPDGLTWTFHLREAVWSDGVPVTARDFVYSLRRLVDPKTGSGYANLAFPVVNGRAVNEGKLPPQALGVSAPDDSTVVLRLLNPTPYLPDLLAHYAVVPVPEHAVRRWGDSWTAPGHYVSNGPFKLAAWRLGDRLTLVRNPRFYDNANVCLDRVDYFPTADVISAERQIRRGELDVNVGIVANRIDYVRGKAGLGAYVRSHPWTDVIYVTFNQDYPPFRDERVRQALAMAIDREFIVTKLLRAGQTKADGFVPPGSGALPAAPDWAGQPFAVRRARARALMAAAGYGPDRPLKFELKFFSNSAVPPTLQADWRAIGADVTLSLADVAVFFSELQAGAFQAGYTDWIADYPDATNFLNLMRSDEPGANYGHWADPEYDRLIRQGMAEPDTAVRARLLQTAERRMLQAAPIAPVFVSPSLNLVNPRVTGWVDNLADVHPKRWICFREPS